MESSTLAPLLMADVSIDSDFSFMDRAFLNFSGADSPGSSRAETFGMFGEESPLVRHDIGTPGSFKYRMLHVDRCTKSLVSPWHGIKLYSTSQPAPSAESSDYFLNFVCKTPRGSRRKFEVAQEEPLCPLRLQKSDGKEILIANFPQPVPCNVGMLPQTYSDVTQSASDVYGSLRNDGRPIECLDIGTRCGMFGEVYSVKPLGLFSMVNDSEATLSWKLVAICVTDELAEKLHGMKDIETNLPGVLVKVRSWLTGGVSHGDIAGNEIGFSGCALSPTASSVIIAESHASWQLLASELPTASRSLLSLRGSDSSSETTAEECREPSPHGPSQGNDFLPHRIPPNTPVHAHSTPSDPKSGAGMKGTTSKAPPISRISQCNEAKEFSIRHSLDGGFRPEGPPPRPSPTSLGSSPVHGVVQRGLVGPTFSGGPIGKGQHQILRPPTNYVFTNARPSLATPVLISEPHTAAHNAPKREERPRKGVTLGYSMDSSEAGEWRGYNGTPNRSGRSTDVATDRSNNGGSLPLSFLGPRPPRSRSTDIPRRSEVVGERRQSSATIVRYGHRFGIEAEDCTPDFSEICVAPVVDPTHLERRSTGDGAVPLAELASVDPSDGLVQRPLASRNSGSLAIHTRLPRQTPFQRKRIVSFQEEVEVFTFGRV